ncbi:hypothetical protein [Actinomyces sp. oral taxon 414]|nr:hypothetical protein [Actinomyces sp. oral taxon 414]
MRSSLKHGDTATDEGLEALVEATAPPQSRNRRYLLAPRAARS